MIWPICCEEVCMAFIATMLRRTTSPERSASARVASTRSRASRAPSAVRRTVEVISANAAAVCSNEAA